MFALPGLATYRLARHLVASVRLHRLVLISLFCSSGESPLPARARRVFEGVGAAKVPVFEAGVVQ